MPDLCHFDRAPNSNFGRPPCECPVLIQLWSIEIQKFGAARVTYGNWCLIYGIFVPFLTLPKPPTVISGGPMGIFTPPQMCTAFSLPWSTLYSRFRASCAVWPYMLHLFGAVTERRNDTNTSSHIYSLHWFNLDQHQLPTLRPLEAVRIMFIATRRWRCNRIAL